MAGIDAFGTVWQMHDGGSPGAFIAVGEVTDIDVLDIEIDDLDVSSHSSPGQWREFVAGMKDAGELSMEVNYDPALHGNLWAAVGVTRQHKIILPDAGAAEFAFSGFISGMSAEAPHDDKLSATFTIKVTGAVTLTP